MRITSIALGAAIAVLAGGTVLAADAPHALMVEPIPIADEAWHPYVKAYGGATIPNVLEWDGGDYDVDAGWLLGGAVGVEAMEGVSFEIDGTYSASEYSGSGDDLNAATAMVNVVLSAGLGDQLAVYGGVGLGGVGLQYDGGEWAFGAGGQVFAGVSFEVAENVSVFGEARYQTAFDLITADGHDIEINRTALLGGVKFGF